MMTTDGGPTLRPSGAVSIAQMMHERRGAFLSRMTTRLREQVANAPLSMSDLERLLEEAWTGGGAAMADAITARDCHRDLELLERQAEEARLRELRLRNFVVLPSPSAAGLRVSRGTKGGRP